MAYEGYGFILFYCKTKIMQDLFWSWWIFKAYFFKDYRTICNFIIVTIIRISRINLWLLSNNLKNLTGWLLGLTHWWHLWYRNTSTNCSNKHDVYCSEDICTSIACKFKLLNNQSRQIKWESNKNKSNWLRISKKESWNMCSFNSLTVWFIK